MLKGFHRIGEHKPRVNERAVGKCMRRIDRMLEEETPATVFSFAVSYLIATILRLERHFGEVNWDALQKDIGEKLRRGREIWAQERRRRLQ